MIKLSRTIFFLLLLVSVACNRRDTAEYKPVSGGFKFSADLTLSKEELKADSVLDAMRRELLNRRGSNWLFFTSFAGNKDEILNEALYQVFKKMPKGGMLHIHATASGDAGWIIEKATSMPGCFIFMKNDSGQFVKGQLGFFPDHKIPAGFLPVQQVYSEDPLLKNKLHLLYTIGPEDDSIPDIWVEFEKIFTRVGGFISYRPVFTEYYRNAFETLASDGVQFAEIRTSLGGVMNEDGTYVQDEALLDLYKTVIARVKDSYPSFDLAIIANSKRSSTVENVIIQIQRITRLASGYPDLIIGFDLNGQEDGQHSNGFFSSALKSSPVPLFLHAGESLSSVNSNIQDALNLNAPRIGHGVNLFYFPELENKLINEKTMLEFCPVSNQELRYVRDFRLHPALGYLQRGVQGTLGSDDPAFFQNRGLTDEYFIAYLAWGLDLRSLKKMLLNSITSSGLAACSIQNHLWLFNKNWDDFIAHVNMH